MKKKNKKPLIALLLVAVLGVVGVTFAYFSTENIFENTFKTGAYKTEAEETFTSPSNWTPGTVTEKKIKVTNKGDVDVAVRISFEEKWTAADGTELPLTDADDNRAAEIYLDNLHWQKYNESSGEHYYYDAKLKPTESLIEDLVILIAFNENVAINPITNCTTSEDGTTKTCTSTLSGYAGATYTLNVKVETAQFDQYKNVWNTSVNITYDNEHTHAA